MESKLVFIGIVITLTLYWIWTRRHLYRFARNFPNAFALFHFGIIFIKGTHEFLPRMEMIFKKNKQHTMCLWLGTDPFVLTADPQLVESVVLSSKLLTKMPICKVFQDTFGPGLLSSKGPQWQLHRRKINPSFNHNVLLSFLPIFHNAKNKIITAFASMANDDNFYDITELFLKTSMEISFETVMGKKLKESNKIDQSFVKNFKILGDYAMRKGALMFFKLDFLYMFNIKFILTYRTYTKRVAELLKERALKGKNNSLQDSNQIYSDANSTVNIKKEPQIFLDNIYKLYQGGVFTKADVIGESNQLLAASIDTTAGTMYFTLVLIAMHPNVQDRLYEELVNAFPDKDFCLDFDQMEQLPYLEMVIKETMRVFPPVGFIGRRVVQDTKINDCILPKGIDVVLCIYHLHRRSDIWGPNAHKFDPDHFLPDNERDRPKCAFIPFSYGARNCIGWRYALFLMRTMISGIVRNYRLECDMKYEDIVLDTKVTTKFKREPLLKIYRR